MLAEVEAAIGDPSPASGGRQPLGATRLVRRATRDLHH
jgi:hypothetical protein